MKSPEGIHCFCHPGAAAEEGVLRSADFPAPRALYFPGLLPSLAPRPEASALALPGLSFRTEPAPEPDTPPPVATS